MDVQHPSRLIEPKLTEVIRKYASVAEQLGQLHPEQLALIYREKWFRMFVPKQYGGLELPLPEAIALEEALAWTDGSMGWVVTLCSGANWFCGFIHPDVAKIIFTDPKVCLAGSGQPSGTALSNNNNYRISGSWSYASGAQHATAFTANCIIDPHANSGEPQIHAFLFLKEEVKIRPDWNAIGLKATCSDSFSVKDLDVPAERCFSIDITHAFIDHPLYRFPFLQLAEATLAANNSGMAVRFLDLAEELAKTKKDDSKESEYVRNEIKKAQDILNQLRIKFYSALGRSWNACVNKIDYDPSYKELSEESRKLARAARTLVDEIYPYCGLRAANPVSEINRVWRDIHTASQHSLLRFPDNINLPVSGK